MYYLVFEAVQPSTLFHGMPFVAAAAVKRIANLMIKDLISFVAVFMDFASRNDRVTNKQEIDR